MTEKLFSLTVQFLNNKLILDNLHVTSFLPFLDSPSLEAI